MGISNVLVCGDEPNIQFEWNFYFIFESQAHVTPAKRISDFYSESGLCFGTHIIYLHIVLIDSLVSILHTSFNL